MEIRIENRPALTVAFIRETGPFKAAANRAWQRMAFWLQSADVVTADALFLGVIQDEPGAGDEDILRYEAALTLPLGFEPRDDMQTRELTGGDYAVALHKGPYEQLHETWSELVDWLSASGRRPAMLASYEIYRNDPGSTPAEELRTEIYLPLQPRA